MALRRKKRNRRKKVHAEKAQENPRRRKAKKENIELASWMTRAQYDLLLSVVED